VLDRENELAKQVLDKQATIEAAKMNVEVEKQKALGNLTMSVIEKTGAIEGTTSVIRDIIKEVGLSLGGSKSQPDYSFGRYPSIYDDPNYIPDFDNPDYIDYLNESSGFG
jgi:hypothetical protein